MTNDELGALVRRIVSDKLRERTGTAEAAPVPASVSSSSYSDHSSHGVYVTIVNTSDACVIEPDVACTHCNYCKSHGH
jgi:hypothetical protein